MASILFQIETKGKTVSVPQILDKMLLKNIFFFVFHPAPIAQFLDSEVRPAPRGASRAMGERSGII